MSATSSGAESQPANSAGAAAGDGGFVDLTRLAGVVFLPLGFIARFPLAMFTVGVTLVVAWATGSYSAGGLASGALGVGSAIGAPLIGALADRLGQRGVVQVVALINSAAMLGLLLLVRADFALWGILAAAFLIGASAPQVGPLARARWIALCAARRSGRTAKRTLSAAMSWESVADELTFVLGPVAVGAIALLVNDYAPLIVAAVLTTVFVTWFAHDSTVLSVPRASGAAATRTPLSALLRPRVSVPIVGMLSVGALFGAMLTSITAFAGSVGSVSDAGFYYGAMGVGSAITALATGALPEKVWLPWRWVGGAAIAFACSLVLPFADSLPVILIAMFGVGLGVGPTLVSIFAIVAHTAPVDRIAIVMTLVSSGLVTGSSASAPLTGVLADAFGFSAAFWVVTGAASLMLILGLWVAAIVGAPDAIDHDDDDAAPAVEF
ncbi:MAG: MFS transporter [Microbacteriaceae bacterium]